MSTKQVSRAAADGRRLRFLVPTGDIEGYVVGMDDYHWLVAQQSSADLVLVHKGSAATVTFTPIVLADETPAIQKRVAAVGQSFWDSIKENR